MNTYECKLVKDGIVKELFYRTADSEKEMLDDLNSFQWGSGNWIIELVEEEDDE